jgi:hypothetical protein
MVGRCPPNPAKTVRGACCTQGKVNLFCGSGVCGSSPTSLASCEESRLDWCKKAKGSAQFNDFCSQRSKGAVLAGLQQNVLTAFNPSQKSGICGKNCTPFDFACSSAKLQAGCGGQDNSLELIALGGLALIALLILIK